MNSRLKRPFSPPQRSCVVCKGKWEKRQLNRIIATPEGIQLDPSGKMNGRGAYLCSNNNCWQSNTLLHSLNQALSLNLSLKDLEYIQACHEQIT